MNDTVSKEASPAIPAYRLGSLVRYRDRQERLQNGTVDRIEAKWTVWAHAPKKIVEPLVIYTLSHPTYAGRRFYTTDERIIGVIK